MTVGSINSFQNFKFLSNVQHKQVCGPIIAPKNWDEEIITPQTPKQHHKHVNAFFFLVRYLSFISSKRPWLKKSKVGCKNFFKVCRINKMHQWSLRFSSLLHFHIIGIGSSLIPAPSEPITTLDKATLHHLIKCSCHSKL